MNPNTEKKMISNGISPMSFQYRIHGLNINSNKQITLLEQTVDLNTDISVIFQSGASSSKDWLWEQVQTADLKKRTSLRFFVSHHELGSFSKVEYNTPEGFINIVLNPFKNELWIDYDEKVSKINLESYFVGPIMGSVLRLRGVLCLHASVVEIRGKAIAFLGQKRSGKSTTAATFARMGHRVLADDLGVVSQREGNFYVQPGYSRLRLRQKTVDIIHPELSASLPLVYSFGDSFYSTLGNNFCEDALPLAGIYILTLNATNQAPITPVSLAESLVVMGQNTFGNHIITPKTRKQEFEVLCGLAIKIPVKRLQIVYDIENIESQYHAVLNDHQQCND